MQMKNSPLRSRQSQRYRLQHKLLLEFIRQYREDAELSQAELGFLLGRDQTFVAKVEAGSRKITFEILEQIAEIVGKPITAFETLPGVAESSPKFRLSTEQRELLLHAYHRGRNPPSKNISRTR